MRDDTAWAERTARELLLAEPLPRRWAHTKGVAAKAQSLAVILDEHAELVTAAAWLHDIGYAPATAATGFHPLDGARYLRDVCHADMRLCRLVANHSCAMIEARGRGLAGISWRSSSLGTLGWRTH
jgi:putative nucleotidyltransferase with HDIG domain